MPIRVTLVPMTVRNEIGRSMRFVMEVTFSSAAKRIGPLAAAGRVRGSEVM
jgi:hypothetical protein